jgi:protein-S-isoprenylcysteine O-methyltransferase Ste14
MTSAFFETAVQWLGGGLAHISLGILLYGIWRGTQRPVGRTTGFSEKWLRSPIFYIICTILFWGLGYCGWWPLPWSVSPVLRGWMFFLGSVLYFPGMGVMLWARFTLGRNYFVSTGLGAQLFAGHQLITHGPFALVRHPMYSGLMLAAFGALLLYATWTTLVFACFAPLLSVRARREETALAAEFGAQWRAYCQRVPAFVPHWHR